MADEKINIRYAFTVLDDEALARLDAIAGGSVPVDGSTIRVLAGAIAVNARFSRQVASYVERLSSVGSLRVE